MSVTFTGFQSAWLPVLWVRIEWRFVIRKKTNMSRATTTSLQLLVYFFMTLIFVRSSRLLYVYFWPSRFGHIFRSQTRWMICSNRCNYIRTCSLQVFANVSPQLYVDFASSGSLLNIFINILYLHLPFICLEARWKEFHLSSVFRRCNLLKFWLCVIQTEITSCSLWLHWNICQTVFITFIIYKLL